MAARKKKRPRTAASAAAESGAADGAAPEPAPRREIRPYIYAAADVIGVCAWSYLLLFALPNRHGWAGAFLWTMVALGVVMGAAMFVRNRWGWRVGAAACGLLIAMWLTLVVILLMTAGFLAGVYGGFGQAAALGVIGIAFISLQLIALLPVFQLKFLLTRAGRRYFKLEPLWR